MIRIKKTVLHWLRAPERIQFKVAVLVHVTSPSYLAD